jgi:hypoxanthine phosphoribosyltransferase
MRIEPLYDEEEIQRRVQEIGREIYRDFADSPLTLVCIAEGARRFAEDLAAVLRRHGLDPAYLEIRARRTEGTTLGPVQVGDFDPDALEDRDVVVVDDIADEGDTLRAVLDLAALGDPRTLRVAVLIDKHGARREPLPLDYVGFRLETGWVIGYGMDVDGEYRELDWIGVLHDDRF